MTRPPTPVATAAASADLSLFAHEEAADRRTLRVAFGAAIGLHLVLLAVQLPDLVPELRALQEKPRVYVLQTVQFEKPKPDRTPEIPVPRVPTKPVPDPTPDDPEPIRLPQAEEPVLELPDTLGLIGLPEAPPPIPDSNTPIQVFGDVVPPVKVFTPPPTYTEVARKARIQGVVIVQAIIDKSGQVTNVRILKGLPMGLDHSAVDAVKQWTFEPATLHGQPVAVYFNLTVTFVLQ